MGLLTNYALAQFDTNEHEWKVTIKVSDKSGNPVASAHVGMGYFSNGSKDIDSITDTNGMIVIAQRDKPNLMAYLISFRVEKNGYYPTWSQIDLGQGYNPAKWNQRINLILKKVGKPTAMYARWVNSEPSVFKKTGRPPIAFTNTAGYDLMAGDWVAPYGKGAHTDIIFTEEYNKKSIADYYFKLIVSFPNKGDGIQPFAPTEVDRASAKAGGMLSPYEAPADGYQSQLVEMQSSDPNRNYFFRVRTALDQDGNIVSARYGKIYGDFMRFTYYYNPTPNDRNIEFDPKQNMLGALQSFEQVSAP